MIIRAVYENNVLKPLEPVDLEEGEEVEISIVPKSLANEFRGVLRLSDTRLIEEIAESDELV